MNSTKKKFFIKILLFIGLYLLSTGISAKVFIASQKTAAQIFPLPKTAQEGAVLIDPLEPKNQPCPINGKLFTKTEESIWQKRRPALVMVENHPDSRPQSGLTAADVVYESVAEGGITRFMGVFYCAAAASGNKIAPVRSARIYFVNLAAEYNTPIYVHVGGGNCSRDEASDQCTSNKKAWALEKLVNMGWRVRGGNDFDTTLDVGYPVLGRDYNRLGPDRQLATEHTMVGFLPQIWQLAEKRGITGINKEGLTWESEFRQWKFRDAAEESQRGTVSNISFDFWKGYQDFSVTWAYDRNSNRYLRATGDQPHTDLENNQQLSAENVIIQLVKEEGPLDSLKHMYYEVIGKGQKALVFQNGNVIEAMWEKPDQFSRTIFKDKTGKEISFVRGSIWVEVVPANNEIVY